MLFGPGFLGTRADVLLDIAVTSLVLVIPALWFSWQRAKTQHYVHHKRIQLTLFLVLTVVVSLLEYDIYRSGGLKELAKGGRFDGTGVIEQTLGIHLVFSNSTAVLWISLIIFSLIKFPRPPAPNDFSRIHKIWGRIAMIDMFLTCITGVFVYVIGFVL